MGGPLAETINGESNHYVALSTCLNWNYIWYITLLNGFSENVSKKNQNFSKKFRMHRFDERSTLKGH